MQVKIATVWIAALIIATVMCGCGNSARVKLPACADVVSLDANAGMDVFTSGKPKVVTYITLRCFDLLDAELLRRQIVANPEFDFLFYVGCANMECKEMLAHFVRDNQLPVTIFIDCDNNFLKANNISDNTSFVTTITDENLIDHGTALIGCRYSPFDRVMATARGQLGL